MIIPAEVENEHRRRLANQRLFRSYYVNCPCEGGCSICAYTGLVTKGHAKHTSPTSDESTVRARQ
jgi:hypothetical protein